MMKKNNDNLHFGRMPIGRSLVMGGASMIALSAMAAALASPALAQDAASSSATADKSGDKGTEVVVVGVRRSLKTAQQIKKDADTVVDSITANDIGAFPDKSVAEALQRVAGITVNRFAATGDTAHFSAEPSGVVVRGLPQVRSEFNGRDIFTADSSRGLSWSDVSPELMGRVDTFKNQTADMIEGGIAGSIDLRTRLPFDQKGSLYAVSIDESYGDLAKKFTPSISGIYSTRWDTSVGEFGVMLNAAYSKITTNSQGLQLGRDEAVQNAAVWGDNKTRYITTGESLRDNTYYRTRTGVSFATQWQNHEHTMQATFQFNDSRKRETWKEYVATANTYENVYGKPVDYVATSTANAESVCATGTTCQFDSNGQFVKGEMLGTGLGVNNVWYGTVPAADGSSNNLICASWNACGSSGQMGTTYGTSTRYSNSLNDTQDGSFNFVWDPTERLKLNFDVQYVHAIQTNYDITADMATYQDVTWNMTGKLPTFTVSDPTSVNLAPGGITNPKNYRLNDLMDHVTDSSGHEAAVRFDAQYSFNSPWLDSLRAGVRFADREQTVRWTTYNWKNVVNNWTSYDADHYYITGSQFPAASYGEHSMPSDFFGGGITNKLQAVYFDVNMLKDRTKMAQTFGNQNFSDGGSNSWVPVCYRTGEVGGSSATHPSSGAGCFEPAEIAPVSEKTSAVYLEMKFGGHDAHLFGKQISGNIGVRYVDTVDASTGGTNFSTSMTYATTPTSTQTTPAGTVTVINTSYYVSADDRKFLSVDQNVSTQKYHHINVLPSFNVKMQLDDTWLVRFAASEGMSRPDIGNLKRYVTIGAQLPTTPTCGNGFTCNGSTIVQTNLIYTGQSQNPSLKPITADNLDLSFEDYFAAAGSFTFDVFYKKFYNYIQYGNSIQNITHDGVTRSVQIQGPVNAPGATIKGFEVAYTKFFDFLPGLWNGLGVQANYTHLINTGVTTSGLVVNSGDGSAGASGGNVALAASHFNKLPLEGLSDDTYNIVAMYEKGSWSGRIAYNWRSEYMVTADDCCIALPVWQKASGFLDASVHWRITPHTELGLEGSNLLDTKTVLLQQVSGPTDANPSGQKLLLPNAIFQNDRRYEATIRMKY
jgi:TonB-dependent receptor